MENRLRVMLVDDDEEEFILLKDMISHPEGRGLLNFEIDWVGTVEEARAALFDCRYDAYLVDYRLGNQTGLDLIREAAARECPAPIIMLTGQGSYEIDMAAMHSGAADYLVKGQLSLPLLERSIRYAIDRKRNEKDLENLVRERNRDLALLQTQAMEMNALQKATSSLLTTLDLSDLIGQILDAAQEAIPTAEQSWLHLIDQPHSRIYQLIAKSLRDPRIIQLKGSRSRNSGWEQVFAGNSLLIEDAHQGLLQPLIFSDHREEPAIRSALIIPLSIGREVIGALSLSAPQPAVFTESNQRLLSSFATTAAAAIQNALLYREVQDLATTDPLTGKLNRRAFFEIGQREIELSQRFGHPLAAMMFDIDHFKMVNDTYGHAAGDQVLIAIADRCCGVIRQVDVLGRLGGDEFAILLPEADSPTVQDIADRVRSVVSETPVATDAGPIAVSISLGAVQAAENAPDLAALLEAADQALYQAKQAGRDCVRVLALTMS